MKDKNGIEVCCENCAFYDGKFCDIRETFPECSEKDYFLPTEEAYKARIADLQSENERLLKEIIDLGTGTLAEKNYQSAMRAGAALCVAAKKLNYDTSNLSVYDLIEVFLKEGNDVLNRLRKNESEENK